MNFYMEKRKNKKATIRDVAKMASVSVASVSRYLNKKADGRLSKEKANTIKRAIKLLDYVPSAAARQMVTKQSKMIAVIVTNIDDYFSTELFKGASNILKAKGYQAFLLDTNVEQQQEKELIKTVSSKYFDGLLLQPLSGNIDTIQSEIINNISTVILDKGLATKHWPQVVTDNTRAAKNATKYFLEHGCNDILILSSEINVASTRKDRYIGVCSVARLEQVHLLQINEKIYNYSAIKKKIAIFLKKQKEKQKKTLIFAFKERWLLEFIPELIAEGYIDDKYVTITGFADTKVAQSILPHSKLIHQNPYLMGASAAEILLKELGDKDQVKSYEPLVVPAKFG